MAKAKKAAKAKKVGRGEDGGNLVVASKVRAYIRSKNVNVSGEVVGALSCVLRCLIDKAVVRTQANGRKTLRPADL